MNKDKIKDIRDRAELVRGATEPGENTAERVGGVLVDTAYALDALNTENAEIKGALDTKASAEDLRALDTKVEETANATPWVSGSGWRAVMTRGCKESIGDDVTMGALGDNSVATGVNATAKGKFSHAEGNTTKAEGENSHAEGYGGVASGSCAHVEGDNTKASGSSSHAEGSNSVAEGAFSHAEGQGSKATGAFSHAEGSGCKATHQGSHAEGMGNVASGDFAHAEGANTTASGNKAHTEGGHTKASGHASHAEGLYNYDDKTFISMVGVGKTNSSGLNAVSVRTGRDRFGMNTDPTDPHHGHSYFLGIGGYKGQAVEDGMKSLQEVVADLPTKEEVSASMAVKADLEDGNVPTVQLGNVAAIVKKQIKASRKRVKRYVIGRAIAPGSLHDSGHENWYCYGYGYGSGSGSGSGYGYGSGSGYIRIPILAKQTILRHVYVDDVEYTYSGDIQPSYEEKTFVIRSRQLETIVVLHDEKENGETLYGLAFCVVDCKYGADDNLEEIWLKTQMLPHLATVRSDSTHHSIEKGKHVWRSNVYMGEIWLGPADNRCLLKPGCTASMDFTPEEGKKFMFLSVSLFSKNDPIEVYSLVNKKAFPLENGKNIYRKKFTRLKEHTGCIRIRDGERVKRYDIRLQKIQKGTRRKGEQLDITLYAFIKKEENGKKRLYVKWT